LVAVRRHDFYVVVRKDALHLTIGVMATQGDVPRKALEEILPWSANWRSAARVRRVRGVLLLAMAMHEAKRSARG